MNSPDSNLNTFTILIVDDDSINQRLLFYHLKGIKCKILFAGDGSEAVDAYSQNPDIKLVLMDLRMPGMNGVEATKKIIEMDPDAKVIALSAYAEEENGFDTTQSGFSDYLTKPIKKDVLINAVKRYIV